MVVLVPVQTFSAHVIVRKTIVAADEIIHATAERSGFRAILAGA
jgi:hypothetical protein